MDVVCDKASLKGLGQTLLILGQGMGAFTLPIFSDKYGRRPVHLISHLMILVLGVAISFSPSYLVFLILRIAMGAVQQVKYADTKSNRSIMFCRMIIN